VHRGALVVDRGVREDKPLNADGFGFDGVAEEFAPVPGQPVIQTFELSDHRFPRRSTSGRTPSPVATVCLPESIATVPEPPRPAASIRTWAATLATVEPPDRSGSPSACWPYRRVPETGP
jgi:hypothetical protein